jgi:hypothetical protein
MAVTEGFIRIRQLPDDKHLHIRNWLVRGGEVATLARLMQQDWKVLTDVNERTLAQQLNRYKKVLLVDITPEPPEIPTESGAVVSKRTKSRNIDPMERMVALLHIQERRLDMFIEREQSLKMPLSGVDKVIDATKGLLLDIQRLRFDLGLDEFRGVQPGSVKGMIQRHMNPDGSSSTTTLFEAVSMADQIFSRAGIPTDLNALGSPYGSNSQK